ncbi:MAG: hypothetical protein ACI8S3_002153 [Alphaproteobacteria bacterium]|jgi:hypothetical protein
MKRWIVVPLAAFGLFMGPLSAGAQNFEKGLEAARAGDFAAAVAQWRPLASAGNVEAQFNIGAIYEEGLEVPADPSEAAGWYGLAAGHGHAQAQYNLGIMYADGRGVPRDDSRALVWLRKAAEQDHAKAQFNLGVFYQTGRGLTKDLAKAKLWFDRAAANGVGPAPQSRLEPASEPVMIPSDRQPVTAAAKSLGPSAGAPLETASLDNDEKLSEPDDDPAAVKTVGLNLYQSKAAGPAQDTAAISPEPDPVIASVPAGSLVIAANFPDGASYRLEVMETRERTRDGAFVMAQTSEMDVDMVVKPGPGEGTLIEWTFGPATVKTAGDPQAGRLASELGKLIEGQKVEYHTTQSGKVTTLGNPGQLSSFYEKSIDRVLKDIDAQSADPHLADDIRANMAPLLSQDYAAARALDLPKLLHFFSGLELAAGKTYSRDSVMSLPPSAKALPSTLDYELKWFDRAAGVAWLSWRQSVDPERAAGAVRAYIETLAAQSGQPAPEKFDIGAIDISDSADYEIDLATGFPKQVIYTRKVELFGFSQTEKRRIRVLP